MKQLILFSIGAVINILGCVAGYFAGQFWGGIICVAGSCMMLMGTVSIGIKRLWGGVMCILGLGCLFIAVYLWQASMWRDISVVFLIVGVLLELGAIIFVVRSHREGGRKETGRNGG